MSGGSLNYAYTKVEDAAGGIYLDTPECRAFKAHLLKVAKALHDIEWVQSCDYGRGDEVEAIMACITPADVLAAARERAVAVRDELTALLDKFPAEGKEE